MTIDTKRLRGFLGCAMTDREADELMDSIGPLCDAYDALNELVECRALKVRLASFAVDGYGDPIGIGEDEFIGIDADYSRRKPLAWAAAFKALGRDHEHASGIVEGREET